MLFENGLSFQAQNKLLWGFRDKLSKEVSNVAIKLMLQLNGQQVPSGESNVS